ncbi:MAG: FAD-binding protein [Verrucomicrobiales bacterium]|nr:FAD-binding protein [Verrucomicrobiales bacterium]
MSRLLLLAEHDQGRIKRATLAALGFARSLAEQTNAELELLLLGENLHELAESLRPFGAARVLLADDPRLRHPLADRYAHALATIARQRNAAFLLAAASTFSKDILPRAAALLDAGMVSDVIGAHREGDTLLFRRVMFAGNLIGTVRLDGPLKVLTVRASAFSPPPPGPELSPVEPLSLAAEPLPEWSEFVGRETRAAGRPDATEARVVVSGGRAIKNAEDFERLIGGLADALGGAVGSSRALVDAGITPNSLQIGQTGKIVAPDLYVAVGISGAIQHLAGMKDTRVIVAINKDADAPIFEVADYGLVADAYQAVPELIQALKT